MSGRRRQALSPTLFPFLAVLVCTLGTLILLLALVANNASETAKQIAEQPVEQSEADEPQVAAADSGGGLSVGQVRDLIEEEEFRLEELVSFRDAQTADLEDRRDRLAHVEDHMRRIRERLKELEESMRAAKQEQPEQNVAKDELEALREELDEKQKFVKKLREEAGDTTPRVVIVPHQGPNGTSRRPIYIECKSDGVTLWPEGVEITRTQLERTVRSANPLDDALRAIRLHTMQTLGDSTPPYPMLIVRPDGIDSYYAARAAMLDWDDQYGYELVPEDVDLAYQDPDPQLREKVDYAIREAVNRQMQISIAKRMLGHRGGGSASGSRRSGDQGGDRQRVGTRSARSTAGGGGLAQRTPPPLSASQMDRRGRRSGFRDHRALPRRGYGSYANQGSGSSITPEEAKRRLERQLEDSADRMPIGGTAAETEGGLADRQQAGGQFASGQQTGKYPMLPPGGMMPDGKGGGTAPKQPNARENGGAFDGGGFSDPLAENQEANSADSAATAKGQPAKQPESVEGQAGESTLGEQGFAGSLAAQAGQGPPASISREATDFQANASPQGNASNSANASAASAAASSSNATSASPSMAGARQASQGAASQSAPPSTMQSPSPSMSATIANQVKRQGVDWALPSNVALAHGNDIVRSIRLRVYPDHLVLLPGGRTKAQQVFAVQEGDFNAATLQMATAVRDRIQKWGAAIPGGRWAPRLSVEVAPGGEANYARLERLMSGSGIPLELRSSTRISDGEDAAGRSTKQGSVR